MDGGMPFFGMLQQQTRQKQAYSYGECRGGCSGKPYKCRAALCKWDVLHGAGHNRSAGCWLLLLLV
jgi:hypothetical protein